MEKFSVKFSETFFEDLIAIVRFIAEKSGSEETARRFYENALHAIEKRSFGADIFEKYHPYEGSPEYFRIYFGHYCIFYVIKGQEMDVRRILWSGMNMPRHFDGADNNRDK